MCDAGVTRTECVVGDHYVGRAEDLISAGLITANQVPGQPGQNKTMCTFYAGVKVGKGCHSKHDEGYLSIKGVRGGQFEVFKGIPDQVRKARHAADAPQRELERIKAVYEDPHDERSSSEAYRDHLQLMARISRTAAMDGNGLLARNGVSTCFLSPADKARILALTEQLEDAMANAEIIDTARTRRLTLVWSAAQAA